MFPRWTSDKSEPHVEYVALQSSDNDEEYGTASLRIGPSAQRGASHPLHYIRQWLTGLSSFLVGVIMLTAVVSSTRMRASITSSVAAICQAAPTYTEQQLSSALPGTPEAAHRTALRSVLGTRTGYTVAFDRLPITLMEPRPDIPNRVYGADAPLRLGPIQVHDILANVTSSNPIWKQPAFQPYREMKAALAKGESVQPSHKFWELDRYKFTYFQALMTRLHPNADWYITQDGDTYLFWGSLMRWLSYFDPKEQHYFGRLCYMDTRLYAQGGAGYVLSKGINDVTYAVKGFEDKWADLYEEDNFGDSVIAKTLWKTPEVTIKSLTGGDPMFFELGTNYVPVSPRTWQSPLFSIHKIGVAEMETMRQFELEHLAQGYDDVRTCDLYEKFAPQWMREVPGLVSGPAAPNGTVHIAKGWVSNTRKTRKLNPKSMDECFQECDRAADCWTWSWNAGRTPSCELQIGIFNIGREEPAFTMGYRVDRISQYLSKTPCKDAALRETAWARSINITDYYTADMP